MLSAIRRMVWHAFPIRFDFIRVISVYAVPVLRRNNRHGRDHKVFVNGIKCGAGASTAAGNNSSSRFVGEQALGIIENTIHQTFQAPGHTAEVNRRSDNHSVGGDNFLNTFIHAVIIEDTASLFPSRTCSQYIRGSACCQSRIFHCRFPAS